jgi:hypothetical protein
MAYSRGQPVKESSTAFIIVILLCVVFGAIIVTLLFENSNVKTKRIEPSNCPQIKGDYGVIPNVDVNTLGPIYSCNTTADPNGISGAIGSNLCKFNNVKSLIDCEVICNTYTGTCKGFFYTPPTKAGGTGSMTFYDTSFTPTSEQAGTTKTVADVYTKQV